MVTSNLLYYIEVTGLIFYGSVVESVGENVEEVKEGDIVIPVFKRNCGECRYCKCPKGNACSKFSVDYPCGMPRDGSSRFKDKNGEKLHHTLRVSSFSEYTVVDVTHVVRMSPDFPIDKASLLSCGVSTGLGAAWKAAEVEEGSTVAIFGLGAVGLAVAEGARLRGASKIIGVDLNPEKFEIGKKFGLTDFINPTTCGEKSTSQVIKEMTDDGADYCFECIGLTSLMQEAFSSCRKENGKTIILGVDIHGAPLSINPRELVVSGKTIIGSLFGGVKAKVDIPIFATKYLNNELNLDGFITHEVNFQDINKAFDLLQARKSLRCIIWMDK
ncbi:alcohol dehydrogenase-like 1 isoform X2 [Lycium ferocissimum]|uniref:alcohol dehydrogenase-like 1 isoform X2 n=1 Tax=Lycium ferocissimum TaxID=112874 RepID=UPI00281695DC|nr:alcohol dehydrogenase-like 1 isoform X2 [Lycium ferocissimum]